MYSISDGNEGLRLSCNVLRKSGLAPQVMGLLETLVSLGDTETEAKRLIQQQIVKELQYVQVVQGKRG